MDKQTGQELYGPDLLMRGHKKYFNSLPYYISLVRQNVVLSGNGLNKTSMV